MRTVDRIVPANPAQASVIELIKLWEDTYNGPDVRHFIRSVYAADADVIFTGASAHGHEQFIKVEQGVIDNAPGRYMRIDDILFAGDDKVVIEAVVLDKARPEYSSPFCAILTVRDGKIVSDHTYLDPAQWPGIEGAIPHVTPGGLGVWQG